MRVERGNPPISFGADLLANDIHDVVWTSDDFDVQEAPSSDDALCAAVSKVQPLSAVAQEHCARR